jgi:hypothetical protein
LKVWGRDDFTKITPHIIGRGANIPGYPQPPPLPVYADRQNLHYILKSIIYGENKGSSYQFTKFIVIWERPGDDRVVGGQGSNAERVGPTLVSKSTQRLFIYSTEQLSSFYAAVQPVSFSYFPQLLAAIARQIGQQDAR